MMVGLDWSLMLSLATEICSTAHSMEELEYTDLFKYTFVFVKCKAKSEFRYNVQWPCRLSCSIYYSSVKKM